MLFLLIFFVVILHSFIHIVVDINYNTLCLCLSVALRPPTAIDFGTHGTALPFRGSVLELSGFLGGAIIVAHAHAFTFYIIYTFIFMFIIITCICTPICIFIETVICMYEMKSGWERKGCEGSVRGRRGQGAKGTGEGCEFAFPHHRCSNTLTTKEKYTVILLYSSQHIKKDIV